MFCKNLLFWMAYWRLLYYDLEDAGILLKIYIFYWDNMVFLCSIYLLPVKMISENPLASWKFTLFPFCFLLYVFFRKHVLLIWYSWYVTLDSPLNSFLLTIVCGRFLFIYFIWILWNQIKRNEICIKLCFMR